MVPPWVPHRARGPTVLWRRGRVSSPHAIACADERICPRLQPVCIVCMPQPSSPTLDYRYACLDVSYTFLQFYFYLLCALITRSLLRLGSSLWFGSSLGTALDPGPSLGLGLSLRLGPSPGLCPTRSLPLSLDRPGPFIASLSILQQRDDVVMTVTVRLC